jgi:digeranylgeranylglycerophospholipid reductase
MNTYDIIVVGGGLAGLSAVSSIAQESDASIALIEAHGIGSNNPTPLTFPDVLDRFGLSDHVRSRYRRFTFHSPLGNVSSHAYDWAALVALDYRSACDELLCRAQEAGRVTVVHDVASALQRGAGGRWQVHTAAGATLATPLLIDASGRGMFANRALSLAGPRLFSHCFGQVFEGCAGHDPEEAFFLAPAERFGDGGGWFYPLDRDRVSFGYATLSTTGSYPAGLVRQRYERARREFAPYAEWLAGARAQHDETGTIPVIPVRRFVYDGLMLVGDAAGQATIWTCMGSEPALVAGQWAGQAAVEAHRSGDFSRRTLGSYQRQWDQAYRRIYRQGAWLAAVIWERDEMGWNRDIPLFQGLTSEQMLARLRANWPQLPWWKVALIRAYDWAGRLRRRLVARSGLGQRRAAS